MPKRGAPSRIVPRVFSEDGGGYSRPAICVHCGKRISRSTLAWGRLANDPPGVSRPVHARCMRHYQLFVLAFWSDRGEGTPTL
jgi:hypothetical protein